MAQRDHYRTLVSPGLNDAHKSHIFSLTKLAKTASEFCGKVASMHENFANQMISLVEVYRKKTLDLSKRSEFKSFSVSSTWDQILNELEEDSKTAVEFASSLQNTVAVALFQEASRKKGLFKKIFTYRDYFQNLMQKSEEELNKKHKLYTEAWMKYRAQEKEGLKDHRQAVYYNSHNAYQLQLAEVNARSEFTYAKIVPEILDDFQVLQEELIWSFAKYLRRFSEVQLEQRTRSNERLQNICQLTETVDPKHDVNLFIQSIDDDSKVYNLQPKEFTAPKVTKEIKETKEVLVKDQSKLKPGLILNEFTEPVLKRRCAFTRRKIKQLESAGGVEEKNAKLRRLSSVPAGASNSLKKASEAINAKSETRGKRCSLACLKSQMDLYSPNILESLGPISEEYADDLEEPGDEEDTEGKKLRLLSMRPDKERAHKFVEHNFLKPAQCYYCKGIVVGIIMQGCRCTACKMDVHKRCRGNVPFCTGSSPAKSLSFDRESLDQDSSAGEYEAISSDSDAPRRPLPPKPRNKVPGTHGEKQQPPDVVYSVYSPPVPPHSSKRPDGSTSMTFEPKECVALFDFAGEEKVDLPIKAGERIQVLSSPSSDWWEGQVGGRKGYFPTSYVQVIQPGSAILRCLYDFESEEGDEMNIEEGQIIVLETDEQNGWMVGTSGGKKGAFPSSYVEKVS